MKHYTKEELERLRGIVDSASIDEWNYGQEEVSDIREEKWDRFYRLDYGNEEEGFSDYKAGLVQTHTLQLRAWIAGPYKKTKKGFFDFGNEDTNAYVNQVWEDMDGRTFADKAAFNAILLKGAFARPYLKCMKPKIKSMVLQGDSKETITEDLEDFMSEFENGEVIHKEFSKDGTSAVIEYRETDVEFVPRIDLIPPENAFVSRLAPSIEEAQVVGCVYVSSINELMTDHPDAHKLNGFKSAKEFWKEVNTEYFTWLQTDERYARWANDNTNYYEFETQPYNVAAGEGAREIVVKEAQVWVDIDDSFGRKLVQVTQVGSYVFSVQEIDERTYVYQPTINLPNRWRGMDPIDTVMEEDKSATLQYRMMEDGLIQSQHPNIIANPNQYNIDSILNREPDSIIEEISNNFSKEQGTGIDVLKLPGPDATGLQMYEKMQERAGTNTGAGKFFQPFESDNLATARINTETASIIENNSNLMLDDYADNFAVFIRKCGMMICKLGKAGGTPITVILKGEPFTVDPIKLPPVYSVDIDIVLGVTAKQEERAKATNTFQMIEALTNPNTANPVVASRFKPESIDKILIDLLAANDIDNPEEMLQPQNGPPAEVQMAIENARAEGQQMGFQEGVNSEQAKVYVAQASHYQAQTQKAYAEADAIGRKVDLAEEQAALKAAVDKEKNKLAWAKQNIAELAHELNVDTLALEKALAKMEIEKPNVDNSTT